jgi:hypothetical protein
LGAKGVKLSFYFGFGFLPTNILLGLLFGGGLAITVYMQTGV